MPPGKPYNIESWNKAFDNVERATVFFCKRVWRGRHVCSFMRYLSAYYLPSTILDAAWMNMTLFGDKHILGMVIVIKNIPFEITAELGLSSCTH